ncbi:MAG: glycosyltransferase family 2 protein [Dechloromonas sp.]|nr:glycosyltransferase family 2 protein [Dechloromonas sp.]
MEMLMGVLLALAGLPVLYLLATVIAPLVQRSRPPSTTPPRRIAILVPAHDEALLIADTVGNLQQQRYTAEAMQVVVIADNCTDETAAIAAASGARVIERQGNPGKGQGLFDALNLLLQEDWDAFLIVDADSHLHPEALAEINQALAAGSRAIQMRYGVLNPEQSLRTRAMELSTASYNALRPLGKSVLNISAGINGNGFCITRETAVQVPYLAHSIVEDIEYHMHLLAAGIKVDFLDHVWVKAQMPIGGRGATVQRVRWERGRILTIRQYAPQLLRALFAGQRRAIDGLIDVLMPPVSLIFLALLLPALFGGAVQQMLGVAGLLVMGAHYLIAAVRYGNFRWFVILIGYVPWYVVWKTWVVLSSMLTERQLPWMRTDRHAHKDTDSHN